MGISEASPEIEVAELEIREVDDMDSGSSLVDVARNVRKLIYSESNAEIASMINALGSFVNLHYIDLSNSILRVTILITGDTRALGIIPPIVNEPVSDRSNGILRTLIQLLI